LLSKGRLEAFSDGVFAIAITLLVLTIAQPTNYRDLGSQLWDRWPAVAAYVVSFAVIGIMWLNHHTVFSAVERVDRPFVYLNLALLLTVVFVPYPTGVLGEALSRGEGARVAAVVYSGTMTLNACAWSAMWLYASSGRRLLTPDFREDRRRAATLAFTSGGLIYALSIGVALINAFACLAFHAALAVYYALDPLSRRSRT
jgi:uncharacterized membrane protein